MGERASEGATASWVTESALISVREPTFASAALQLRPKTLAALAPVSLRLLRDAATKDAGAGRPDR